MTIKPNLRPLGNKVLIQRKVRETVTEAGIYLPETNKAKSREGTVVAAGPGKLDTNGDLVPMTVQVGDQVLFRPNSGNEVKNRINNIDETFLVMPEDEILAILTEDPTNE